MQLTFLFTFFAGMLSFFSPCVFPLVPAFVATITGGTINNGTVITSKRLVIIRALAFTIGFSFVFIIFGLSASFIGQMLSDYRQILVKIGGFIIIVFGFQMVGFLKIRFLLKEKRIHKKRLGQVNAFRAAFMGIFFAIGWSPCIGLTLSSILLLASSAETMSTGTIMLVIYSIGFAIPFIIIGVAMTISLSFIKKINRWLPLLSQISGWLLIVLGLLMYTNHLGKLSASLSGLLTI